MDQFPLLFETQTFSQIIMKSYLSNHTPKCNKMMLLVLRNWTRDYAENGHLYDLFATWRNTLQALDSYEAFWRSLMVVDELKEERTGLLADILREGDGFQLFAKMVEQQWKDVMEHCCHLLRDEPTSAIT
jgi:hypothetical protein